MLDAIGNPIKEGWAAQCDAGRGSSHIRKVYVLGTKGKSVLILGNGWNTVNDPIEVKYMVEAYKNGDKEVSTYTKIPTRIIMLGDNV